jgi:hypothetical protein
MFGRELDGHHGWCAVQTIEEVGCQSQAVFGFIGYVHSESLHNRFAVLNMKIFDCVGIPVWELEA